MRSILFRTLENKWLSLLLCFFSGAVLVLAFEPVAWAGLSFLCLPIVFYSWVQAEPRQAFFTGFAFGLGLFIVGVSWVYVSLSTYGGMPLWMGLILVVLFASVLALFIGWTGYLTARLLPNVGVHRLLLIPPCWVLFEWLKSWVLTGFPWLEIGYTQTPTWMFALAPVGGVYLVSFALAAFACGLVSLFLVKRRIIVLFILSGAYLAFGQLNTIEWSKPDGKPLQIGLVQANVPIEHKWLPNQRDRVIGQFAELSQRLHKQNALDLLIWPETALPLYRQQTDAAFWKAVAPHGVALLSGLVDSPAKNESYNAAILSCDGQQQLYRKRHLVPFGEYLPLRFLFNWVLDYLQLPMSDFSSWQGEQTLECAGNINIGLSICYEDAFGGEYRAHVGDATLLVNISEDAWFGDSLAPHQRLQMAQMRARELSRPLIRSANTGPSVVIDERGKVLAKTAQFEVQTLVYKVQPQTGTTLYKRFGNWIVWLSILVLFGVGIKTFIINLKTANRKL